MFLAIKNLCYDTICFNKNIIDNHKLKRVRPTLSESTERMQYKTRIKVGNTSFLHTVANDPGKIMVRIVDDR